MTDQGELLAAYDAQLRGAVEGADDDTQVSTDGPLVRIEYPRRGLVSYRSLAGLTGAQLDELIARQRDYFAARGMAVEWKTRGHDHAADLPERLLRAGFEPEAVETVVVAEATRVATDPALPPGVVVRPAASDQDLVRIAAMESTVWGEDWSWLADDLARRLAANPATIEVFVADAGGEVVSAAWIVYQPGTDFAGLWGGSTLAEWRRRGLYRALVAVRAQHVVRRGFRYLQVDASDESRPVLERLGFVAITTTTPYVFTPTS